MSLTVRCTPTFKGHPLALEKEKVKTDVNSLTKTKTNETLQSYQNNWEMIRFLNYNNQIIKVYSLMFHQWLHLHIYQRWICMCLYIYIENTHIIYSGFTPQPLLSSVPTHGPKPRRRLVDRELESGKWFMKHSLPSSLVFFVTGYIMSIHFWNSDRI